VPASENLRIDGPPRLGVIYVPHLWGKRVEGPGMASIGRRGRFGAPPHGCAADLGPTSVTENHPFEEGWPASSCRFDA
jgi:hypothetical protein